MNVNLAGNLNLRCSHTNYNDKFSGDVLGTGLGLCCTLVYLYYHFASATEQHSSGSTDEQTEAKFCPVQQPQLESGKAITGLCLPDSKTPASRATRRPSFWDAGFSELKLEMEKWSPCPEEACYPKCQGSVSTQATRKHVLIHHRGVFLCDVSPHLLEAMCAP